MSQHDDIVDPPDSYMVGAERTVLYQADGTPLKRQIGFGMTQTGGTFPQLTKGGKKIGGATSKPPKKGAC